MFHYSGKCNFENWHRHDAIGVFPVGTTTNVIPSYHLQQKIIKIQENGQSKCMYGILLSWYAGDNCLVITMKYI